MLDEDNIPNWILLDSIPGVLGIPANELRAIEASGNWNKRISNHRFVKFIINRLAFYSRIDVDNNRTFLRLWWKQWR